jgi:hypothetical protein
LVSFSRSFLFIIKAVVRLFWNDTPLFPPIIKGEERKYPGMVGRFVGARQASPGWEAGGSEPERSGDPRFPETRPYNNSCLQ